MKVKAIPMNVSPHPLPTDSFSLLSLNCFGLWLPNTRRRLLALARELEQSPYQVVCLQEIQLHQYQNLLIEGCASYPYPVYEPYFHCPKGGLLTLSRLPSANTSFEPYVDRGFWYTPMLLDRSFFKGMLITRLTWNDLPMVIINTHLLANFAGDWERRGMYARVEEKQLQQLAETVESQPADSLIVVVGDFNIPRGGRLYHDFLGRAGLTDLLAGDTRPTLRLPIRAPSRFSLAIDYVLVRMSKEQSFKINCDLCFSGQYPLSNRRQGYLSDHYGIELRMTTT
jgi:endonuclease/exonuclease/phosphatase family metal-dependent hydrolase